MRSRGWTAFAGIAGFGLLKLLGGNGAALAKAFAFAATAFVYPLLFPAVASGKTGETKPAGEGPLISSDGRGSGVGMGLESEVDARGGRGGAGFEDPFVMPLRELVGEVMRTKSPVDAGVRMGDPDSAGEGG